MRIPESVILVQPSTENDRRWMPNPSPIAAMYALAGYVPAELYPQLVLDNGQDINKQTTTPLDRTILAISGVTSAAPRMQEIAGEAISLGAKVIVGGIDVSQRTDSWKAFAAGQPEGQMAVIRGEIEGGSFSQAIQDAQAGNMRLEYFTPPTDLHGIPLPTDEFLARTIDYLFQRFPHSRGCYMVPPCNFCGIQSTAGDGIRLRPIEESIAEMEKRGLLYNNHAQIMLTADSIGKTDMEFFEKLAEKGAHFASFIQADLAQLATNTRLWEIMNDIGPTLIGLGLESSYRKPLGQNAKRGINNLDPVKIIHNIRSKYKNIAVQANWMVGFDFEAWGKKRFSDIEKYVSECQPDRVAIGILTPYIGTTTRRILDQQHRMIDTDLTHFSGAHLTFQLKGTTETGEVINDDPQQFMNGLDQLKRRLDPQVKQWSKLVQKDIDFKSAPVVVI